MRKRELKDFPVNSIVKVSYKYPWRDEEEKEIIGMIEQVNDLMVLIKYPAIVREKQARSLNINQDVYEYHTIAKTIAIYHYYQYQIQSVSEAEVNQWRIAADVFHLSNDLFNIIEKYEIISVMKPIDIPEEVLLYTGDKILHSETVYE